MLQVVKSSCILPTMKVIIIWSVLSQQFPNDLSLCLSTQLPWLLALQWNLAKDAACTYLHNSTMIFEVRKMRKWSWRDADRYSCTLSTCIAYLMTLFMRVLCHFYTLNVWSASNQNCLKNKGKLLHISNDLELSRCFFLFFFLNTGSNFGNKTNGDSDTVISGRPKIKKPSYSFHLSHFPFPSYRSYTLFSSVHHSQIHVRVLYALRTGMRFPNLCFTLFIWIRSEGYLPW